MKNRFALASIAALVGLAACSDSPVAPSATPTLTKPSFVVTESPITPVAGQVWVCKAWDGAAGGAPQVTTVGAPARPSTLTIHNANIANLGAGAANCVHVATSTSSNQDDIEPFTEDTVTVTEILDAGTSFVGGTVFFSGGLQSPETFGTTSRTQAFNNFHGVVIVFENEADPVGNQGCTPGYWKQSQHFDSWPNNVPTSTTFASVFGSGPGTLLTALNTEGGPLNQLRRHGAAAYLNSLTIEYAYTTAQVIEIVNGTGAYANLTVEQRKNLLDAANNGVGGCPLN